MTNISRKKILLAGAAIALILAVSWLLTTENNAVWPVRNTIIYHLYVWFNGPLTDPPVGGPTGALAGSVRSAQGQPIEGATVLLAYPNGATFSTRTDAAGQYQIEGIPPGTYRPVAGAPGFRSARFGDFWQQVRIEAGHTAAAAALLAENPPRQVAPGTNLQLSGPTELTCQQPLASQANRWQINFNSNGQPNQPAFYYTPTSAAPTDRLPLLMIIYPGPADTWECVSAPLAKAGYAVLAAGPAYTFDLESDLDELERMLDFARREQFPGTAGEQIALLGGSYSSLHVQRMLQRGEENLVAALLLGPPTDLFEMRRQLENGTYIPPFGLDQAFRALGLPGDEPLRYFDYSGAYHLRADFPPVAILHSRHDEIVPYQQSELLAKNMTLIGARYELYFFNGASHYLMDEGGDALTVFDLSLDFMARQFQ